MAARPNYWTEARARVNAQTRSWADGQSLTTICSVCGWSQSGLARVVIAAIREHRVALHPQLPAGATKAQKSQANKRGVSQ
jgi:hypothetical protein